MAKLILSIICAALMVLPGWAVTHRIMPATVVSCHDGDTCRFKVQGRVVIARFSGIDAPEIGPRPGQPGGIQSRDYLLKLMSRKRIGLQCHGSAKGKRKACDVFANGRDVQSAMVSGGWAWDYPQYSKGRYHWQQLWARFWRRGIWWKGQAQAPWNWRHLRLKQVKMRRKKP